MVRFECLEQLARELIGDGKTPDLFFVTDGGNVVTITADYRVARIHWERLRARYPLQECALENRTYGVIASVEPEEDGDSQLVVSDDSESFLLEVSHV